MVRAFSFAIGVYWASVAGASTAAAQQVSLGVASLSCYACNSAVTPAAREPEEQDRLIVRAEMLAGEREANRRELGRPMARIVAGISLGVTAVVGASLIFAFSERFTSHRRSMQPDGSFEIEDSFAPGWGLLCLAGLVALAGGILFVSGVSRFERLARRNRMLEQRLLEH